MENQKIKKWYIGKYPDDEVGQEINNNITFYDLFNDMDCYKDVYCSLGVCDSLIRERVFTKLAQIMGVNYNYVYEQWLKCEG